MALPPGKLPNAMLGPLLERYRSRDPRVVAGPQVGADVALLDMGNVLLAVKADPVTFATDRIGWYAVHVNANDIACAGAEPRWFLATLLLPEGATDGALVEQIFAQVHSACDEVGATLIGGHSEITIGLDRPIVAGHMLGEVGRDSALTTGGAQPNDALILTKSVAIEGTAILAAEASQLLLGLPSAVLAKARGLLDEPGISVLPEARIAREMGGVHALHDPTEGGLRQAVAELAEASGLGAEINLAAVPIRDECRRVCEAVDADPLGLISSGALLVAVAPEAADELIGRFDSAGIACGRIGTMTATPGDVVAVDGRGHRQPFVSLPRDELARLLEA